MSPDAALSVSEVSFAYGRRKAPGAYGGRKTPGAYGGRRALDGVTFEVAPGSFTALLGPNGAGKTTLYSLITRLFDGPDGAIRIFGHEIRKRPGPALARLGVVFQQPTLDLDLSVRQNLRYFAALHGLSGAEADRRIETELGRLDMAERAGETVRKLNGGHRRRVEIARALLHRPGLLLLDEPTVGLDVPTRGAIVEHVHTLCREEGIGVLWATHLIDEVAASDRVIVLHEGTIRDQGKVDAVVSRAGAEDLGGAFARLTEVNGP